MLVVLRENFNFLSQYFYFSRVDETVRFSVTSFMDGYHDKALPTLMHARMHACMHARARAKCMHTRDPWPVP